jgi:hypothetical protein
MRARSYKKIISLLMVLFIFLLIIVIYNVTRRSKLEVLFRFPRCIQHYEAGILQDKVALILIVHLQMQHQNIHHQEQMPKYLCSY